MRRKIITFIIRNDKHNTIQAGEYPRETRGLWQHCIYFRKSSNTPEDNYIYAELQARNYMEVWLYTADLLKLTLWSLKQRLPLFFNTVYITVYVQEMFFFFLPINLRDQHYHISWKQSAFQFQQSAQLSEALSVVSSIQIMLLCYKLM